MSSVRGNLFLDRLEDIGVRTGGAEQNDGERRTRRVETKDVATYL